MNISCLGRNAFYNFFFSHANSTSGQINLATPIVFDKMNCGTRMSRFQQWKPLRSTYEPETHQIFKYKLFLQKLWAMVVSILLSIHDDHLSVILGAHLARKGYRACWVWNVYDSLHSEKWSRHVFNELKYPQASQVQKNSKNIEKLAFWAFLHCRAAFALAAALILQRLFFEDYEYNI